MKHRLLHRPHSARSVLFVLQFLVKMSEGCDVAYEWEMLLQGWKSAGPVVSLIAQGFGSVWQHSVFGDSIFGVVAERDYFDGGRGLFGCGSRLHGDLLAC